LFKLFALSVESVISPTLQSLIAGILELKSGVPKGSVIDPLLFLAYVNGISRNIQSTVPLLLMNV